MRPLTGSGHGALAVVARWAEEPGGRERLEAVKARFSTCYRGGLLDLYTDCPGLTLPFFKVMIVTSGGHVVYEVSTPMIQNYNVQARSSGWMEPADPSTGAAYDVASKSDLIVQLWAFSYKKATVSEIAEVRG